MGHIHKDSTLCHICNSFPAKRCQSKLHPFCLFCMRMTETVIIIPGQRNQPDSHLIKLIDPFHFSIHNTSVFNSQKGRNFSLPPVAL